MRPRGFYLLAHHYFLRWQIYSTKLFLNNNRFLLFSYYTGYTQFLEGMLACNIIIV